MWDDFHEEEIRKNAKSGGKCGWGDEKNLFLAEKGKKKAKKGSTSGARQKCKNKEKERI